MGEQHTASWQPSTPGDPMDGGFQQVITPNGLLFDNLMRQHRHYSISSGHGKLLFDVKQRLHPTADITDWTMNLFYTAQAKHFGSSLECRIARTNYILFCDEHPRQNLVSMEDGTLHAKRCSSTDRTDTVLLLLDHFKQGSQRDSTRGFLATETILGQATPPNWIDVRLNRINKLLLGSQNAEVRIRLRAKQLARKLGTMSGIKQKLLNMEHVLPDRNTCDAFLLLLCPPSTMWKKSPKRQDPAIPTLCTLLLCDILGSDGTELKIFRTIKEDDTRLLGKEMLLPFTRAWYWDLAFHRHRPPLLNSPTLQATQAEADSWEHLREQVMSVEWPESHVTNSPKQIVWRCIPDGSKEERLPSALVWGLRLFEEIVVLAYFSQRMQILRLALYLLKRRLAEHQWMQQVQLLQYAIVVRNLAIITGGLLKFFNFILTAPTCKNSEGHRNFRTNEGHGQTTAAVGEREEELSIARGWLRVRGPTKAHRREYRRTRNAHILKRLLMKLHTYMVTNRGPRESVGVATTTMHTDPHECLDRILLERQLSSRQTGVGLLWARTSLQRSLNRHGVVDSVRI